MALNMISQCAFGIDADALRNPDHELIQHGKAAFSDFIPKGYVEDGMIQLLGYFPDLISYLPIIPKALDHLRDITKSIIDQRIENNVKGNDFIARLIDLLEAKKVNRNSDQQQIINKNRDLYKIEIIIFTA